MQNTIYFFDVAYVQHTSFGNGIFRTALIKRCAWGLGRQGACERSLSISKTNMTYLFYYQEEISMRSMNLKSKIPRRCSLLLCLARFKVYTVMEFQCVQIRRRWHVIVQRPAIIQSRIRCSRKSKPYRIEQGVLFDISMKTRLEREIRTKKHKNRPPSSLLLLL